MSLYIVMYPNKVSSKSKVNNIHRWFYTFSYDFSIIIDGIVGRSYLSDIGVDNIKLIDGKIFIYLPIDVHTFQCN